MEPTNNIERKMDIYSSISAGPRQLSVEAGYMVYDDKKLRIMPKVQYDNNLDENFKCFSGSHKLSVGANTSYKFDDNKILYVRPDISYKINADSNYLLESTYVHNNFIFKNDQFAAQLTGNINNNGDALSGSVAVRPFYQFQIIKGIDNRFDVEEKYDSINKFSTTLGHKLAFTLSGEKDPWLGASVSSSFPITDKGIDYAGTYFWIGRCLPEINKDLFAECGIWVGKDAYTQPNFNNIIAGFGIKIKFGDENRWWP